MAGASITSQPEPQPPGSVKPGVARQADMFTGKRLDEAEALSETLGLCVVTVDGAESDVMAVMRRTGTRRVWDPSGWRVVDQYPAPGQPIVGDLVVLAIAKHGEQPLDGLHLDAMLRARFNELTSR